MLPVLASFFRLPADYVARIDALRARREAVIAVLDRGKLVSFGSREALQGDAASLEAVFVALVAQGAQPRGELSWL